MIRLLLAGLLWIAPLVVVAGEPSGSAPLAAVVNRIGGRATVTIGDTVYQLELLDQLPVGAVIELDSGSLLEITLPDGRRFALVDGARATVGHSGLERHDGELRQLTDLPALPVLAELVAPAAVGRDTAATRIRGAEPGAQGPLRLEPPSNAVLFADDAVLAFTPVPGLRWYRITVEAPDGSRLLSVDTTEPSIELPDGLLRAGCDGYHWSVQSLGNDRPPVVDDAVFHTLAPDLVHLRATLRDQVQAAGDPGLDPLLALIDARLGLRSEAAPTTQRPDPTTAP